MALFDSDTRSQLKSIVDDCDQMACNDLQARVGKNEDSVTQNLVKEISEKALIELAEFDTELKVKLFSQKSTKTDEETWGVDAVIILYDHKNQTGKICLFEAKVDRPQWDKKKENGHSRFSTQLSRQVTPYNDGCVVWEQFYKGASTLPKGSVRSGSHSTCILHEDAIIHNKTHPNDKVWGVRDMDILASLAKENNKSVSMGSLVEEACEGKHGSEIQIGDIISFAKNMPAIPNVLIIGKAPPEYLDKIFFSLTRKNYKEVSEDTQNRKPEVSTEDTQNRKPEVPTEDKVSKKKKLGR